MVEEERHEAIRLDHHLHVEEIDGLRGVRVIQEPDAPEHPEHLALHPAFGATIRPPPLSVSTLRDRLWLLWQSAPPFGPAGLPLIGRSGLELSRGTFESAGI